jgi:hypothetical protein
MAGFSVVGTAAPWVAVAGSMPGSVKGFKRFRQAGVTTL